MCRRLRLSFWCGKKATDVSFDGFHVELDENLVLVFFTIVSSRSAVVLKGRLLFLRSFFYVSPRLSSTDDESRIHFGLQHHPSSSYEHWISKNGFLRSLSATFGSVKT